MTCSERPVPNTETVLVDLAVDLHRAFQADRELVAFAAVLAEARALVTSGCVPRTLRHQIADACTILAGCMHDGPHLKARR